MDVLLIATGWKQRALIRAQLIEEGFDVMAVETSDEGELLLSRGAARPRAVVLALEEDDHPAATLTAMIRLVPDEQLIVLTAAGALSEDRARAIGATHVIARPYDIAAVVGAVRDVVKLTRNAIS